MNGGSSATINLGQSLDFAWSLSGGAPASVTISPNITGTLSGTTKSYTPVSTGQAFYTLSVSNSAGTVTKQVSATVNPVVAVDTTSPSVQITSHANNAVVSTPNIALSGTASDNVAVTTVQFGIGNTATVNATGTTNWTAGVAGLSVGANTITVTAKDAAGNSKTTSIVVNYQPATTATKPVINTFTVNGGASAQVSLNQNFTLAWNISTSSPLTALSLDQGIGSLTPTAGVGSTFSQAFYGKSTAGIYEYTLTATNSAGTEQKKVKVCVAVACDGTVTATGAPNITSFLVNNSTNPSIKSGQSVQISWNIQAPETLTNLSIDRFINGVQNTDIGSVTLSLLNYQLTTWPLTTAGSYEYRITAKNSKGTTTKSVMLTVNP